MAKRTTHRSRSGKKLYAVRDASGRFEDIQTYERAHGQDLKRGSAAEKKAKAKAKVKVKVKAAVKKKKAAPRRKKAAAKKK
jgi:hypothetical protein